MLPQVLFNEKAEQVDQEVLEKSKDAPQGQASEKGAN